MTPADPVDPSGAVPTATAPRRPTVASLRLLLQEALTGDSDLDAFLIDHYPAVHKRTTGGMDRVQKLNLLLDGCDPAQVLATLQGERAYAEALRKHEDLLQYDPDPAAAGCPFPGLQYFEEEQAAGFFGREGEVAAALEQFGQTPGGYKRWLSIEGASGTGKSSLARAGLVPAVRQGQVRSPFARWRVGLMRPGTTPLDNLAQALCEALKSVSVSPLSQAEAKSLLKTGPEALRDLLRDQDRGPKGTALLLVIDQMEEFFTLAGAGNDGEAAQCDALVGRALSDGDGALHLLTTVRLDFLTSFPRLPQLEAQLNTAARYYLGPMKAEVLRQTLDQMATRAGLSFEPGLLDRIEDEAGKEEEGCRCAGTSFVSCGRCDRACA